MYYVSGSYGQLGFAFFVPDILEVCELVPCNNILGCASEPSQCDNC